MNFSSTASQFVLGTAQLGMDYGIANRLGKPSLEQATELVHFAWEQGMRCFDTAQSYGASEAVLGQALATCRGDTPKIISKLPAGTDIDDIETVISGVRSSLQRLGVERLWGLLLHDEDTLDAWAAGKARGLEAVKQLGLVRQLGVSVYTCKRALQALERRDVDIVQVPANVFDRRMLRAGVFAKADALGKAVFVRSVFLQGLFFIASDDNRLNLVPHAKNAVEALIRFCTDRGLILRQFAIDHVKWMSPTASMIIGTEATPQVAENLRMVRSLVGNPEVHREWEDIWKDDLADLVDPRRWPKV